MWISWGGTKTVLLLNYCLSCHYFSCLTTFPLFLHSLTSLISKCLSLLFGTQEGSRRLKPFSTDKKRGTQRGFSTRERPQGPTWFHSSHDGSLRAHSSPSNKNAATCVWCYCPGTPIRDLAFGLFIGGWSRRYPLSIIYQNSPQKESRVQQELHCTNHLDTVRHPYQFCDWWEPSQNPRSQMPGKVQPY